jgi:dihydroorotase
MSAIVIRGARLLDPANQVDRVTDITLRRGVIDEIGPSTAGDDATVIDAGGKLAIPGLIDLCARLREPGALHKAHIKSEAIAASRAGITTLCCPPDTDPVIDEPAIIDLINQKAAAAQASRVVTLGALTVGLAGEQLAEMWSLHDAGCVGVSNADRPIASSRVLRRAFAYAANCSFTVHINPVDHSLAARGCAHEGAIATRLGLAGIPVAAETTELARVLELVADTGVRAHIGRLSSASGVELVARAKQRGLAITADVSAH